MNIFQKEFGYSYGKSYSFGYTVYARLDPNETSKEAYEHGFLPCSTNPESHGVFYMARSVRVPLAHFSPSSENRRVLKKFEGRFTERILSREELSADPAFRPQFLSYFALKHGEHVMSSERLEGYFNTLLPLRAVRYEEQDIPMGYVLEIADDGFTHYWYSSYDPAHIRTGLGMWLMLDSARRAKEEGREHLYLGTAYGEKGKYKTNFSPLEFWDGTAWNNDETLLARYIREDADRRIPFADRFNEP